MHRETYNFDKFVGIQMFVSMHTSRVRHSVCIHIYNTAHFGGHSQYTYLTVRSRDTERITDMFLALTITTYSWNLIISHKFLAYRKMCWQFIPYLKEPNSFFTNLGPCLLYNIVSLVLHLRIGWVGMVYILSSNSSKYTWSSYCFQLFNKLVLFFQQNSLTNIR
jgi:hypothetical protein